MIRSKTLKARLRRLSEIASGNRFDDFYEGEIFELILSYILDDEDSVKIYSRRLSEKFSSLSAAMDAPVDAITDALGGDDIAAEFFKLVPTLGSYYRVDKINGGKRFASVDDIAEYCVHRFSRDTRESLSVLLADRSMKMLGIETISDGNNCMVDITYEKVAEAVFKYGASSFILVHNHPGGYLAPSDNDIAITLDIAQKFQIFNKRLSEHIIVTNNSYIPIMQMMRLGTSITYQVT